MTLWNGIGCLLSHSEPFPRKTKIEGAGNAGASKARCYARDSVVQTSRIEALQFEPMDDDHTLDEALAGILEEEDSEDGQTDTDESPSAAESTATAAFMRAKHSLIKRHLELGLEKLNPSRSSDGSNAPDGPTIILLTLAPRLDRSGDVRPSRTSFILGEFAEFIWDFPLLPPQLVPHRPDGCAQKIPQWIIGAAVDHLPQVLCEIHSLHPSAAVVTAGHVARRMCAAAVGEAVRVDLAHVRHPSRWHQEDGTRAYDTLRQVSALFAQKITPVVWKTRVAAAYRAYARIQWALLPDERKKELAEQKKLAYADLPDERKREIAAKIQKSHLEIPPGVKEQRAEAVAARAAARSPEARLSFSRKIRALLLQQWEQFSADEKQLRLARFLGSRSSQERSTSKSEWWRQCSVEKKDAIMGAVHGGYADKMTPERQKEVGRKRAATYAAHPEKRAKARDNALRNIEQCRENLKRCQGRVITDDEKQRRAKAVAATSLRKFIDHIETKHRLIYEEGTEEPLNERQRLTLRKRMNTTFKAAELPATTNAKLQQLTKARTHAVPPPRT